MTGGLLGCISGVDWLPQPWLQVQDAEYLREIAARIARGPEGAGQVPVEPVPHPQSILSSLEPNKGGELELGKVTRVAISALPDPKPIGQSVSVHAWRLTTTDGQTMYVKKVRRLYRDSRREPPSERQRIRGEPERDLAEVPNCAQESKNELYKEFCRQLRVLLDSSGEMKPKEVGDALGLVRSQTENWLNQAERDGLIRRTSKRPVKFGIRAASLL